MNRAFIYLGFKSFYSFDLTSFQQLQLLRLG
ncbi:uncharacterized protein METZ01_LOCUS277048, partial [marine metagenome]